MGHESSDAMCIDSTCGAGTTKMGSDTNGGGKQCTYHSAVSAFNGGITYGLLWPMQLCCGTTAVSVVGSFPFALVNTTDDRRTICKTLSISSKSLN
jgi:hypothetical protein